MTTEDDKKRAAEADRVAKEEDERLAKNKADADRLDALKDAADCQAEQIKKDEENRQQE